MFFITAFPNFHSQMADSPKLHMNYSRAQAVTHHGKIKGCCLTAHLCYCWKKISRCRECL